MVAAVVVPCQFASLAVVTLPLTLPLILDLQGAGPAAVAEGLSGMVAVKRSRALLRRLRWQLAVPFVGLVVAGRLVEGVKATLLSAVPSRLYQDLIELPLVVLLGGTALSLLIARLQDVLPYVAFEGAQALETAGRGSNNASNEGSSDCGGERGGQAPAKAAAQGV
ncbi:hypothetical protein C2E20_2088 [Micractinium conductrix]|uniref:Uncharacterized protein n=1 Tax=Micractinium conductrix TaxID=554055 RepID=A0A2P6VKG5_9CHLO|nr:hypothetical protein C2E20_2088 [Micractinium conductrix]|eukprot:PSC74550.1 hypothetical protein C2E20_2088 [Micractinium conductrix]